MPEGRPHVTPYVVSEGELNTLTKQHRFETETQALEFFLYHDGEARGWQVWYLARLW